MLNQKRAKVSLDEGTKAEYVIGAPETNAKCLQLFLALLTT